MNDGAIIRLTCMWFVECFSNCVLVSVWLQSFSLPISISWSSIQHDEVGQHCFIQPYCKISGNFFYSLLVMYFECFSLCVYYDGRLHWCVYFLMPWCCALYVMYSCILFLLYRCYLCLSPDGFVQPQPGLFNLCFFNWRNLYQKFCGSNFLVFKFS